MSESHKCSRCGAELPPDAPGGHCITCLLQLGLASEETDQFGVPPSGGSAEKPAKAGTPNAVTAEHPSEKPGDRIGHYKLLQQIGEGGCGVVYMAEQEQPVRRRVALKIIKLGMDTRQVIARFEAERQALAMMDHPNIAKVLDAGATPTGRPYFVMELVRGVKITTYCDQQKLSTRQRLDLFISVCAAIQHAHQKGIIHRDIKPSNILVTEQDGKAIPKIIDFGIAKATTDQRLTDKTLFTAFEQFLGTPAYMSPEQAGLGGLDIDTRSDIYSLGVLLYELLTGHPPFDAQQFSRSALHEILRVIRENEPPRPSARLTTLTEQELTTVAQRRQIESAKLPNLVRGDLDWIVMKALEKDRTRRYETANGLARDIERHLNSEPVMARPPSNLYRFQKLVRRNKLAVSAVSTVTVALLLGMGVSTWALLKEREARRQAEADKQAAKTEAVKSKQVAQFLKDMLQSVGPSVALGRDTTMLREILDKTAESIGKELTNQPAVEAELRSTIGFVYFELGEHSKAELMYRQSLDLKRHLWGNESLAIAVDLQNLAEALRCTTIKADAEEPERLARQALAIYEKSFGRQHPSVGAALNYLSFLLNKPEAAEVVLREALAINLKTLGEEHPQVGLSLSRLGTVLAMQGKLTEAETTLSNAVTIQRKALSEQTAGLNPHVELGWTLTHLADVLGRQNRLAEAVTAQREGVAMLRRVLGDDNPDIAPLLGGLSRLLKLQGKLADAETTLRELLAIRGKLLGKENADTVATLNEIAIILGDQGMLAEREATAREALAISRKLQAAGHTTTLPSVLQTMAYTLYLEGKFGEAEPLYREALELMRESGIVDQAVVVPLLNNFARTLDSQGKLEEAETMRREALAMRRKRLGNEDPRVTSALFALALTLKREGKLAEVKSIFAEAAEAAERGNVPACNELAWHLATQADPAFRDGAKAVMFAEKAVAATQRKNWGYLDTLAAAYAEAGEFAKAVGTQKEAIALNNDERLKNELASRLKLYESNSPYREP